MIHNKLCAYCRVEFKKIQNDPCSRTVEHLIPNSLTLKKRNNNLGDFYACKKCNSHKSMMDNLIGKIIKFQSFDSNIAYQAMSNEDIKSKKNPRLEFILEKIKDGDLDIKLPFNGEELYSFMEYLGKGQYLKKTGKIFSKSNLVMKFIYMNKEANILFSNEYKKKTGINNFDDLLKNKYTEKVGNGECMVYSKKNNEYMFVFHHHTIIIIEIYKNTHKTRKMVLKNKKKILDDFYKE